MVEADTGTDERVDDTDTDTKADVDDDVLVEHPPSMPADELIAALAAHDEALAADVHALHTHITDLQDELDATADEIDDLTSRLKRTHADFQNYKKRARKREQQVRERATEDLVERLLDIRDNLVRALEQDDDVDIREGIEVTLSSFDRILGDENVNSIEPEPGDSIDPERHEVVMQVDGDQPPGRIEEIYRPGYTLAGTVLRPAQVTVSKDSDDPNA